MEVLRSHITVQFSSQARDLLPALSTNSTRQLAAVVRRAAVATLQNAPFGPHIAPPKSELPMSLDAFLVSDEEMRDLNFRARGKNKPTDVLSFPLLEGEPMPLPPDAQTLPIGDLILALETSHRQATERNHDMMVEVAFLTIHGTLHLLGYDHGLRREREVMFALQNAILEQLLATAPRARSRGRLSAR